MILVLLKPLLYREPSEGGAQVTALPAVTPLPRIRSAKVSEVVARTLLNHILDQGLQPGDSLPNEREMTSWLGVARGSLREALRLLEAHGVITVKSGPGGGPVVRASDPETYAGSTTLLMQFMRVRFGELIDARILFEPQLAAAAATSRTDGQVAELRVAVAEMETADRARFHLPYNRFHRVLAEACANRVLLMAGVTFRKVWDGLHPDVSYTRESMAATALAHRELADAVAAGDAAAATDASSRYLRDYRAWLTRHQPALLDRPVLWMGAP
jgi:DNA-binding FadR family transcriptional regulator